MGKEGGREGEGGRGGEGRREGREVGREGGRAEAFDKIKTTWLRCGLMKF